MIFKSLNKIIAISNLNHQYNDEYWIPETEALLKTFKLKRDTRWEELELVSDLFLSKYETITDQKVLDKINKYFGKDLKQLVQRPIPDEFKNSDIAMIYRLIIFPLRYLFSENFHLDCKEIELKKLTDYFKISDLFNSGKNYFNEDISYAYDFFLKKKDMDKKLISYFGILIQSLRVLYTCKPTKRYNNHHLIFNLYKPIFSDIFLNSSKSILPTMIYYSTNKPLNRFIKTENFNSFLMHVFDYSLIAKIEAESFCERIMFPENFDQNLLIIKKAQLKERVTSCYMDGRPSKVAFCLQQFDIRNLYTNKIHKQQTIYIQTLNFKALLDMDNSSDYIFNGVDVQNLLVHIIDSKYWHLVDETLTENKRISISYDIVVKHVTQPTLSIFEKLNLIERFVGLLFRCAIEQDIFNISHFKQEYSSSDFKKLNSFFKDERLEQLFHMYRLYDYYVDKYKEINGDCGAFLANLMIISLLKKNDGIFFHCLNLFKNYCDDKNQYLHSNILMLTKMSEFNRKNQSSNFTLSCVCKNFFEDIVKYLCTLGSYDPLIISILEEIVKESSSSQEMIDNVIAFYLKNKSIIDRASAMKNLENKSALRIQTKIKQYIVSKRKQHFLSNIYKIRSIQAIGRGYITRNRLNEIQAPPPPSLKVKKNKKKTSKKEKKFNKKHIQKEYKAGINNENNIPVDLPAKSLIIDRTPLSWNYKAKEPLKKFMQRYFNFISTCTAPPLISFEADYDKETLWRKIYKDCGLYGSFNSFDLTTKIGKKYEYLIILKMWLEKWTNQPFTVVNNWTIYELKQGRDFRLFIGTKNEQPDDYYIIFTEFFRPDHNSRQYINKIIKILNNDPIEFN